MWKSDMEAHSGITLYSAENRSSGVQKICKNYSFFKSFFLLSVELGQQEASSLHRQF